MSENTNEAQAPKKTRKPFAERDLRPETSIKMLRKCVNDANMLLGKLKEKSVTVEIDLTNEGEIILGAAKIVKDL